MYKVLYVPESKYIAETGITYVLNIFEKKECHEVNLSPKIFNDKSAASSFIRKLIWDKTCWLLLASTPTTYITTLQYDDESKPFLKNKETYHQKWEFEIVEEI